MPPLPPHQRARSWYVAGAYAASSQEPTLKPVHAVPIGGGVSAARDQCEARAAGSDKGLGRKIFTARLVRFLSRFLEALPIGFEILAGALA